MGNESRILIYNMIDGIYASIIRSIFKLPRGEKYMKKITLQQLIEHKTKIKGKEHKQFEYYVVFLDELSIKIQEYFPFINMDNVTLEWTSDQILNSIVNEFLKLPKVTLTKD